MTVQRPADDDPSASKQAFRWSFSIGSDSDAARALPQKVDTSGETPNAEIHEYKLDWRSLLGAITKYADPLRPVRQALAIARMVLCLGLIAAGVTIGMLDDTINPYWGGIYGLVFAAVFYKMTSPRG